MMRQTLGIACCLWALIPGIELAAGQPGAAADVLRPADERNVKVFNRALTWKQAADGFPAGIVVYGTQSVMRLTGVREVSGWIVQQAKSQAAIAPRDDGFHELVSSDTNAVQGLLREFEWPVEQYPVLEGVVRAATGPWSLEVVVPGRMKPLARKAGPAFSGEAGQTFRFDLAAELRRRGYVGQYMRANVVFALDPGAPARAEFSLVMPARRAIIAQLPKAVTAAEARDGVAVACVILDDMAQGVHGAKRAAVQVGKESFPLKEVGDSGLYRADLRGLDVGESVIHFTAPSAVGGIAGVDLPLSVNDGRFAAYNPETRQYEKGGQPMGFLSGDLALCGNVPFFRIGEEERMVNGMADFRTAGPGPERTLWPIDWLSLTARETAERIAFLGRNGYRVMKLANWEPTRLDAGGRVSPFGVEMMALILQEMARNGIHANVDIYHDYLGWQPGGIILDAYYDAGYRGGTVELDRRRGSRAAAIDSKNGWVRPEIQAIQAAYFRQYLTLFRNDTRIVTHTAGGEADASWVLGPAWVNAMHTLIRSLDPNHEITVDQNGALGQNDGDFRMDRGTLACLYGVRWHKLMHATAVRAPEPSDLGIAVNLKSAVMCDPAVIHAEGDCYMPTTHWDPAVGDASESPGFTSEAYRLMVRDALWLSLLQRIALFWNWQQIMVEDEHLVPTQISDLVNWERFRPALAPVYVRIHTTKPDIFTALVKYEEAFGRLGVQFGVVFGNDPLPDGIYDGYDEYKWKKESEGPPYHVIDPKADSVAVLYGGRFDKAPPPFERTDVFYDLQVKPVSAGGKLPDRVLELSPRVLCSEGYRASFMVNVERDVIIAYVRNVTHYESHPAVTRCPNLRAGRVPVALRVTPMNLAATPLVCSVFDLDQKKVIQSGALPAGKSLELGMTGHDFAILISPSSRSR